MGDHALAWAAYLRRESTVRLLLRFGADASARNGRGRTAMDRASDPAIARALRAALAASGGGAAPPPAADALASATPEQSRIACAI